MPVAAAVAGPLVERNTSRIIPMKIPLQPPKLMVAWRRHVLVYLSLTDRVASYRFALERLVIGTPETHAEVERVLNQLQGQIDRYRTLPPTWVREPSLAANH
jgi:hypothetical protein